MKVNMGSTDRIIRVILALVFFALILTNTVSGVLAIILGVLGVVFLLTSAIRSCPLYMPFGISTIKK